ncbi:hypothetical protein [Brasilonema sp. UFV-L1]|uniref:hypothetical protein n=2 Tax=Brasilonema sp. UFV-L1 TaxID=2234130 RepID=UPI0030D7649F
MWGALTAPLFPPELSPLQHNHANKQSKHSRQHTTKGNYRLELNSNTMQSCSMNALEKLLNEKKWNISDLAREYGKQESPGISDDEAIRKYGSLMRKVLKDPEDTKHRIVKRVIEILGGELVVRVKRVEELTL